MRKIITVLVLIISFFLIPDKVSAHFSVADKGIQGIMHIAPDDDPIVGEQAAFYFEFRDISQKFRPAACDCTFIIEKEGKEIYAQPLFENNANPSLTNPSLTYTFPERNIYKVKIVGKSITANSFEPFALTYDVRLERVSKDQPAKPQDGDERNWFEKHFAHSVNVLISLALFAGFVIFAVIQKQRDNN